MNNKSLKDISISMNDGSDWSLSEETFRWIEKNIPANSIILELGSGEGTQRLSSNYRLFSIEHNRKFLNLFDSTYIYAPLVQYSVEIKEKSKIINHSFLWYDCKVLSDNLPTNYDLVIVDGPPSQIGREGFFWNLNLFDTTKPILLDDINRLAENKLMLAVSKKLQREPIIYKCSNNKKFAVI